MRKLYYAIMAMLAIVPLPSVAADSYTTDVDGYCLIQITGGERQCYWCTTGGASADGRCKKGSANCGSLQEIYVYSGANIDNTYTCGSNGFCRTSCETDGAAVRWVPYGGIEGAEVKQILAGGCNCDQWRGTSEYRCAAGYYEVSDGTGPCVRCPALTGADGTVIYGNSTAGASFSVQDCWFGSGDGPFAGDNGVYEFINACHAS